jgi:GH25 family lysozyme M1 (1,4-beta-N-acetylmuramidase)
MHRVSRTRLLEAVALALALGVAVLGPIGSVDAATTTYSANCSVNLRSSTSTSATIEATIATGTVVTASGTVSGSSWSGTCVTAVSGSSWYSITAVNGTSVSSLYGVSVVYAATGLFNPYVAPTYVEGIDVSTWQGTIDYTKVKAAGKRFVIAKATEGIGLTDPKWTSNKTGALAAGLAMTGYHFARPDGNTGVAGATAEADWFVSQLGLQAGMLVPALDLEVAGSNTVAQMQAWVGAWLGEVYAKTGIRPMIYTSPAFWSKYLGNTAMFANAGYTILWVAHWFVASPTVPASNWGGHGWTFWQYDDCGSVPGISGCVDLDRYHNTDFTTVTYGANFAVAAGPTSSSAKQGAGASFAVSIARTFFTLPVAVSVSGLPAGATATLTPTSTTGTSATLSVTTSKSGTVTPVGTYPLTFTGTGNGLTRKATATLVVTDGIAPTVTAPASRLYARTTLGSTTTPVRTSWSASDPSGIASYTLERLVAGGSWTAQSLPSPTTTSLIQALTFGATYRYVVRATDGAGNASGWVYGSYFEPLLVQQSSSAVSYSGTWTSVSNTYASGGSLKYATSYGASATYGFTGSSVSWVAYRGPNRGSAAVYIDGVYKATVSLYTAYYYSKQIVFAYNWAANGTHTIRIVCLGTSGHPRVDVDAFVRLYNT